MPHDRKEMSDRELLVANLNTVENVQGDVSDIKNLLYGDNTESNPGLKLRVDRIEQRVGLAVWAAATAGGAAIAALVGIALEHLTRK